MNLLWRGGSLTKVKATKFQRRAGTFTRTFSKTKVKINQPRMVGKIYRRDVIQRQLRGLA